MWLRIFIMKIQYFSLVAWYGNLKGITKNLTKYHRRIISNGNMLRSVITTKIIIIVFPEMTYYLFIMSSLFNLWFKMVCLGDFPLILQFGNVNIRLMS